VSAEAQRRLLVVETSTRGTEALRHALSVKEYDVALGAGETEAIRIVGPGSPRMSPYRPSYTRR
jgi:hypothetical protein